MVNTFRDYLLNVLKFYKQLSGNQFDPKAAYQTSYRYDCKGRNTIDKKHGEMSKYSKDVVET